MIFAYNPHWSGQPQKWEHYSREVQASVFQYLDERQILCLIGPRRTGKTTLLRILLSHLIGSGVSPKSVLYFSFDELLGAEPDVLDEIIEYYLNQVVRSRGDRKYIFLDEIQNVDYWQAILKRHYDILHPDVKFVVTGSSSLWIKRRSRESLAGRAYDFMVWPLSFREFLAFRGVNVPAPVRPVKFGDIEQFWRETIGIWETIWHEFTRFLLYGGFPELAIGDTSPDKHRNYIWTYVIEKTVLRDLTRYFPVESPKTLVEMLRILAWQSSKLMTAQNLAQTLNLSPKTISKYLSYLEQGYLVDFSYNYTKSRAKQVRTSRKVYLTDTGLITALAPLSDDVFTHPEEVGPLVESLIRNHLHRLADCYFWRDEHKNEVDIVVRYPRALLPVEVKFSARLQDRELRELRLFMRKQGIEQGVVATKSLLEDLGDIWAIPAPLFLLLDWRDVEQTVRKT
ncbi:MAG: ATP-binding protein [Candidatus Thermoplasmatota archaeon]